MTEFVPKPPGRVSKYLDIANALLERGEVVVPVPKGMKDAHYAHNLYISLHSLLARKTGKKPKLSVKLGDKNTVGAFLETAKKGAK